MSYTNASSLPAGTIPDVLTILFLSLAANPCEEIGWRGFALPRLQDIYNPFVASLVIGILSGLRHLPFFYWRESPMAACPFLPWFVGTICVAFVATWLFNNTNRSLLIVSLLHISLNTFSVLVSINSFYVYAAASVAFVIFILAFFGKQFFQSTNRASAVNRNKAKLTIHSIISACRFFPVKINEKGLILDIPFQFK